MTHQGGCHCGAVRYEVSGDPQHVALCHCSDCRKSSGAPMVAWAAFTEEQFKLIEGDPVKFNSTGSATRSFCPKCVAGLDYRNAEFPPAIFDLQLAMPDDPDALPPGAHIQTAERLGWMNSAHSLPEFERFPG
ncbi:GFA family protein [uncultured Sphingorhabdus sp.]|uniref:GFA family protein n=1 Tax=uncultured Sphingorhabdus sp. TaxID=1686106 RepID=UPI002629F8D5|nr:GFA family protein [uncultured Sphingorhabdus sp.]